MRIAREQVYEIDLARGEQGGAGDAEPVMTGAAFELAAGGGVVGFGMVETWVNRLASLVDRTKAEGVKLLKGGSAVSC